MDFDLAPDDHPRRQEVRAWLADHPSPSGRQLAEAGYVVPHWPRPWGLEADPIDQLVIDEELRAAGVRRPFNPIGIGWAAPTILLAGTDAQKERYLLPALAGEDLWCQLFSEPGAGSDLAAISTRATPDGDGWVIRGSKIWTSGAHWAKYGILIARTDPDAPKQRGISYFLCPMKAPGVTIRPIVDMTGSHSFNEVFLDDVFLSADALVGSPGDGWRLAKATLANERVSLSSGGALWGMGPTAADLAGVVRAGGGTSDPLVRQRLARLYVEGETLRLLRLRTLSARLAGRAPGPEASVQKLLADEHGQRIMEVAKSLAGAGGMLERSGPAGKVGGGAGGGDARGDGVAGTAEVDHIWHYGFLFAPALTIGGGTWAVQRDIIATRVLGLPGDPDAHRNLPWREAVGQDAHR